MPRPTASRRGSRRAAKAGSRGYTERGPIPPACLPRQRSRDSLELALKAGGNHKPSPAAGKRRASGATERCRQSHAACNHASPSRCPIASMDKQGECSLRPGSMAAHGTSHACALDRTAPPAWRMAAGPIGRPDLAHCRRSAPSSRLCIGQSLRRPPSCPPTTRSRPGCLHAALCSAPPSRAPARGNAAAAACGLWCRSGAARQRPQRPRCSSGSSSPSSSGNSSSSRRRPPA